MEAPEISIIIPLFNEETVFPQLIDRLENLLVSAEQKLEILLIDDGSSDQTPELVESQCRKNPRFRGVILSRNFGHQTAISAGMNHAYGTEAVFIIDGDLQDPPELLPQFYESLRQGYDIVYAVRKNRQEGPVKKLLYYLYYRILKSISYINIPLDSGDFCMMSRRVVDIINAMPEESLYIRGVRSWVGFRQKAFEYDRDKRADGESKYSLKNLFQLAFNGILNFSSFPIKFITQLGIFSILVGIIYLGITLFNKYVYDSVPQGFTTIIFAIVFFSGVQLVSLGIIGEYVMRIFFQVKNRPNFIVKKHITGKDQD